MTSEESVHQVLRSLLAVSEDLSRAVAALADALAPDRAGMEALDVLARGSGNRDGASPRDGAGNADRNAWTDRPAEPHPHPAEDHSPIVESPVAEPACPTVVSVQRWLASRGIGLVDYRLPGPADATLDEVASDLGTRAEQLQALLAALRRAASTSRPRTLYLRDEPHEVITATLATARRLHELGLPSHCRYQRGTRQLSLRVG
jgi:hypothetical protein